MKPLKETSTHMYYGRGAMKFKNKWQGTKHMGTTKVKNTPVKLYRWDKEIDAEGNSIRIGDPTLIKIFPNWESAELYVNGVK